MPAELTERQAFLALNALPGLGPLALNRLLDAFGGDPRAALRSDARRLSSVPGVGPAGAAALRQAAAQFDPAKEEARMEQSGVVFLSRADLAYPPLLREIHDPPVGLYRKGPYTGDGPCVAIVGSRRATSYGQGVAQRLGGELARHGFCVVSGLARGVDTAAHAGALAAGGRTVAVLGTGIDVVYPPENLALYRQIAETGAVLSENPFGRPADRDSFAVRSRIISGLCEAVVVVESDAHGGAMATARFAGEQGRLLFAVPGRIDQSLSAGCNQLIRDGAALLSKVEDLLQEVRSVGRVRHSGPARPEPDQARVLRCFLGGSSPGPAELAERTGLPAEAIGVALAELESKGFVSKRADGTYEAAGA
jgi:DNA processing protein